MTDHIPANISDEQRANLAKLAAYLRTLPVDYPDFAMDNYTQGRAGNDYNVAHVPECGTAACAAGHGPLAGVRPIKNENWYAYSQRAFTSSSREWDWIFSASWSRRDNTAHGAASRIERLLTDGLPDNAADQHFGYAPLSYATTAAEGVA